MDEIKLGWKKERKRRHWKTCIKINDMMLYLFKKGIIISSLHMTGSAS